MYAVHVQVFNIIYGLILLETAFCVAWRTQTSEENNQKNILCSVEGSNSFELINLHRLYKLTMNQQIQDLICVHSPVSTAGPQD